MTNDQHEWLMTHMEGFDNEDLPDGAWEAMLKEGALDWSRMTGIEVDEHDAFMDYVTGS